MDRIRGPFTLFPDFDRQLIFSIGLVTPIEEACAGAELVADPCELTEADVVARDIGRLVFKTDNVFEDDSRDTKAGYIVTGDVSLPDGGRAHLHARLRVRIVDGEFRVLAEEFTLRPIGG